MSERLLAFNLIPYYLVTALTTRWIGFVMYRVV